MPCYAYAECASRIRKPLRMVYNPLHSVFAFRGPRAPRTAHQGHYGTWPWRHQRYRNGCGSDGDVLRLPYCACRIAPAVLRLPYCACRIAPAVLRLALYYSTPHAWAPCAAQAPEVAAALAAGLRGPGGGRQQAAEAAWEAVWPKHRLIERDLYCFGMEVPHSTA